MRECLSICLGIFAVMALSNAIVPVLPSYAQGPGIQGAIYSVYFLGACCMTLPAGLLSDRYGRVPVMRAGLVITIATGAFLAFFFAPALVIPARLFEGIGAGLFVASAMAYMNSLPDHRLMSGYLMAALNLGLMLGLIFGGVLAAVFRFQAAGIMLFTILTLIPLLLNIFLSETDVRPVQNTGTQLSTLLIDYRWLWYSAVILVGTTGVVTALYPGFSNAPPDVSGVWIAGMSVATIISVIVVSRTNLFPVRTIRISAVLMAGGIMLSFVSPAGFLVMGALAGIVMIAQMEFLAGIHSQQGAAMGLFSTTSYFGMSVLPFLAGIVAEATTFFAAFCLTALAALSVALTIGRCNCR